MADIDPASRLRELKKEIVKLRELPRFCPEFKAWGKKAERLLATIYGSKSVQSKQFTDIRYSLGFFTTSTPESDFQEVYLNGLKEAELFFDSLLEEHTPTVVNEPIVSDNFDPKKIFVVHGRDEVARTELVDVLKNELHLEPIVLMDQASGSKTVIEKFEDHTLKVGYAFVILTPDDIGCLKDDFEKHNGNLSEAVKELKLRARENVILELGYFVGKLGRGRVCCINKGSQNLLPSDLHGIVTIRYSESVKDKFLDIQKELKQAGYVK